MQVRCTAEKAHERPFPGRGLFYTDETQFHFSFGKVYDVFGMGLYNGGWSVLIIDGTGLPNWVPLQFFEAHDAHLSGSWIFSAAPQPAVSSPGWHALFGYELLVESSDHFDGILSRDEKHLLRFFEEIGRTPPAN